MAEQNNTTRSMMKKDFGDVKMDKEKELSESMTISNSSQDEYAKAINNVGGNKNE